MSKANTLPAYHNDWTRDDVKDLTDGAVPALLAPRISLMGGTYINVYALEGDEYMVVVYETDGEVRRFGIMSTEAFETLAERVEPISLYDHEYPNTISKSIDELCHTVVSEEEGPSYDMDDDTWDWPDEDKELGIGTHIGGSRR